jgi:hypothetical protein
MKEERVERIKRDSREMAAKLFKERRVTLGMAVWALKQSGHSRDEVERWVCEVKK